MIILCSPNIGTLSWEVHQWYCNATYARKSLIIVMIYWERKWGRFSIIPSGMTDQMNQDISVTVNHLLPTLSSFCNLPHLKYNLVYLNLHPCQCYHCQFSILRLTAGVALCLWIITKITSLAINNPLTGQKSSWLEMYVLCEYLFIV